MAAADAGAAAVARQLAAVAHEVQARELSECSSETRVICEQAHELPHRDGVCAPSAFCGPDSVAPEASWASAVHLAPAQRVAASDVDAAGRRLTSGRVHARMLGRDVGGGGGGRRRDGRRRRVGAARGKRRRPGVCFPQLGWRECVVHHCRCAPETLRGGKLHCALPRSDSCVDGAVSSVAEV